VRRADIQGLRGVAVLVVVLYHADLWCPGGFSGVDVFFAVSGYVITRSLLPELGERRGIAFSSFYARRVRRLLPALALMLVAVAAVGTFAAPIDGQRTGALTGLWASFFAANLFLFRVGTGYFDPGAGVDPLLHTWTLAVEEQFYLVFPLLLVLGWRLRGRRGAAALVGALSVVSLVSAGLLAGGADDLSRWGRFAFYGSPTRAWEFGAGALACLALRVPRGGRAEDVVGAVGLAAIAFAAFAIGGAGPVPGPGTLLPVLGACAVMVAPGRVAGRVLAAGPLTWLGDLSYSWYLWHWPLIVFARAFWPGAGAAAAALALLPAWASYRYVETPFRRDPRFRGHATLAVAAVAMLVPVVASGALLLVEGRVQGSAAAARWHAAREQHLYVTRGCDDVMPLGLRTGARWAGCRFGVERPRGTVYLLGDSNAGQFGEGLVAGANRAGYDVVLGALEGCPFVDLRVGGTGVGAERCRDFDRRSLLWLERARPSLVVIANRSEAFIDVRSKRLAPPAGGRFTSSRRAKKRLWQAALTRVLRRLDRAGVPAVVVHPVPWIATLNDHCAVLLVLRDGCVARVSLARAEHERRDGVEAERAAVAVAGPPAATADFVSALCGPRWCSSARGRTLVYEDRDHLSPAGAMVLAPELERLVRRHAAPRQRARGSSSRLSAPTSTKPTRMRIG
jgi:peptidoglycan/LPS O-acetylase OafA/YrhL